MNPFGTFNPALITRMVHGAALPMDGSNDPADNKPWRTQSMEPSNRTVSIHKFNSGAPRATKISIFEFAGGKNYNVAAYISETDGGPPILGPTSPGQPAGVLIGGGFNLDLDIGNTVPNLPDTASLVQRMFYTPRYELRPNTDYYLNVVNMGNVPDSVMALRGYP